MDYSLRLNKAKKRLQDLRTRKKVIEETIVHLDDDLKKVKNERMLNNKISLLLNETTKKVRHETIKPLEEMATLALRRISNEDNSRIKIDLTEKFNKPFADVLIEKEINGEKSLQNIIDSNGGGYADIVSTILRQIFVEQYDTPSIKGSLFLDEPGKMVDSTASMEFANFLKSLSDDFERQNVIVTHDSNIMNIVDKCYFVTQDSNGISSIELIDEGIGSDEVIQALSEAGDTIE